MTDWMEEEFQKLCARCNVECVRHDHKNGLDFFLPALNTYVEVKQFHSDRIGEQMKREKNVIAIQGRLAMIAFGDMLIAAYNAGRKANVG